MPSPEFTDMEIVCPGLTAMSGPGDMTVVEVKPQPAGVRILPKTVMGEALPLESMDTSHNPDSDSVMSRMQALLWDSWETSYDSRILYYIIIINKLGLYPANGA